MSKFDWYILSVLMVGAGLPTLYFFYLGRLVADRPILLFLCGFFLILVGVHGLDLLVGLQVPLSNLQPGEELTQEMIMQLKHNNEVWTYIFPIATAAIGANLISTAIVTNRSSVSELSRELAQAQELTGNLRTIVRSLLLVAALAFASSLLYLISTLLRA
ncbi:hypothetical protein [Vreelandella alkaliphila]|uniref:Uncharacterized protein n=1 Tax=Vreelandella alkaliphila TaxID=272774 RepID=A0AAJ2VS06_9GAMM|nr:hypothetical protein [Halomonas alkaliphila]AYF32553.1 hypothetical protein CUU95_01380 [Halomonas alkaliphila]MDX5978870.1 hypothetical protein [Halomonas alkaliphila]